jgi:lysophospholipase L1-like esterase
MRNELRVKSPVERLKQDDQQSRAARAVSGRWSAQRGSRRSASWIGNAFLLVASLILLFVIGEVMASLLLPKPIVWRHPQERYVHDASLHHRLKPNQVTFTHAAGVTTNSYGLRDEEFTLKPLPGVLRILCLGDSLTFGNGVAVSETYPKRLEAILNASSGRLGYQVINAGVPAYDTWQEVAYLRQHGLALDPALVIVGFYANDIVPRPTKTMIPSPNGGRPQETSDASVRSDAANQVVYLLKRSRVLLFARERFRMLLNRVWMPLAVIHERSLLHGTRNEVVEAGFREVSRAFEELGGLGRVHGFGLLVVIFPMAEQVRAQYPNADYPARVEQIATENNIPVIDLLPDFLRASARGEPLFIEWDGHPTAWAHEIAARRIHEYLTAGEFSRGSAGAVLPIPGESR